MIVRGFVPFVLLALTGCASGFPPPPEPIAHVDHVIIGTSNLESGMKMLEWMAGARLVEGGSHPGRGTRNALMSLGDGTYLELLAPDPVQTVDNEEIRELRALNKLTPIGWAVSGASEVDLRYALVARGIQLSNSEPGSRRKPDGSLLRWVTFGHQASSDPFIPFFIFWDDPALHPSRTSPGGCRLGGIGIHHPSAERIGQAIAPLGIPVTVTQAASPRMLVSLNCRRGGMILG